MHINKSKASNYSFSFLRGKKRSLKTESAPNEASVSCRPSWLLPLHEKVFCLASS